MDKYAPYVFSAYGIALGLLAATTIAIVMRLIRARQRLRELEEDRDA